MDDLAPGRNIGGGAPPDVGEAQRQPAKHACGAEEHLAPRGRIGSRRQTILVARYSPLPGFLVHPTLRHLDLTVETGRRYRPHGNTDCSLSANQDLASASDGPPR